MAEIQTSITVETTPEHIEEFSRYAESWPNWFTGVVAAQPGPNYPEVGSTAVVTFEAGGVTFDLTLTVIEYVVGELVRYEISGMATGEVGFYNEFYDDGAIEVTAYANYTLPGGVVGQVADVTVVERRVQANFESAMSNMHEMIYG